MKGKIQQSIDMPDSHVNGLAWGDDHLWALDHANVIHKIDPSNGRVLLKFESSGYSGLEWYEGNLLNADHRSSTIYELDSSDGKVLASYPASGPVCSGVAWDGRYIWNGEHDEGIAKIDPRNGEILEVFGLTGERTHGLAFDGSHLWYVDTDESTFYKVEIPDFKVVGSFESPQGTELHGLTWDGECLWFSDTSTCKIHRVKVEDTP